LVDHLAEFTGASACYVGKVDKPIKGIKLGLKDDENDQAHHIAGSKPQIQFLYANDSSSEIMKEKILQQDEGVTFKLFIDEQTNATNPCIFDSVDGLPKHILIDEVVRNKDMHFYKVPKLGSYLAIKLEYNTCLFEEAYDSAVENYMLVNDQIREQETQKQEWEAEQKEKEEATEEGEEPEERNFQTFEYAPFKTSKV
jgi:hypothetical protein